MLELLASDLRSTVQDVLAIAICVAALIWGSGPERAVASIWLILFQGAVLLHQMFFDSGFRVLEIDWFLASIDILAALAWISIALHANRNYTLWIAGLQIVAVMAHLARGLSEIVSPVAYAVLAVAPGWLQLFLLAGGLILHRLRLDQYGPYRDWRNTSPPRMSGLAMQGGEG